MLENIDRQELYDKEDEDKEEMDGYTILDERGLELGPKKKKRVFDDGSTAIASEIPENETTVIIDNFTGGDLNEGDLLDVRFQGEVGSVFSGDKKIGDFKPAFIKKLSSERNGSFVKATMYSVTPPVMIKLQFFLRKAKNTVKIIL